MYPLLLQRRPSAAASAAPTTSYAWVKSIHALFNRPLTNKWTLCCLFNKIKTCRVFFIHVIAGSPSILTKTKVVSRKAAVWRLRLLMRTALTLYLFIPSAGRVRVSDQDISVILEKDKSSLIKEYLLG